MDFVDLLKAVLMNQAAHTQGHMQESYDQRMGQSYVDYGNMIEVMPRWVSNPRPGQQTRAASRIYSAGFKGQDEAGESLRDTEMKAPYDLASAIYKAMYLAGLPRALGAETKGDDKMLNALHGSFPSVAIAGGAVGDVLEYLYPDSRFGIKTGYSAEGLPLLMATYRF